MFRASSPDSADGEACGTFSVGFLKNGYYTLMGEQTYIPGVPGYSVLPQIIPLTVIVDCDVLDPEPGDCNRDGFLTLAEHRHLAECFDGVALSRTCPCLDMTADGDIDLRDFAAFQNLIDSRE